MLRLLLVVEYLVLGVADGEEGGAGACAAGVGVLGGVVGDELAGLRETCGDQCLYDGYVIVARCRVLERRSWLLGSCCSARRERLTGSLRLRM